MKRIRAIQQHDVTDCGATCLAAIAQYYGSNIPISQIRQLAGTDQHGTSIFGIVQAAEVLGLHAKAVKGHRENLPLIPVHRNTLPFHTHGA